MADLRVAVGLDSTLATGHNSLGLALCELGRFEDALKSLDAAIERGPNNHVYLNNRGLVHYRLGDMERAIQVGSPSCAAFVCSCVACIHCIYPRPVVYAENSHTSSACCNCVLFLYV